MVPVLAAALKSAVSFIEHRPSDATADDDVTALEGVAAELLQIPQQDLNRLVDVLGSELADWTGLSDRLRNEQ